MKSLKCRSHLEVLASAGRTLRFVWRLSPRAAIAIEARASWHRALASLWQRREAGGVVAMVDTSGKPGISPTNSEWPHPGASSASTPTVSPAPMPPLTAHPRERFGARQFCETSRGNRDSGKSCDIIGKWGAKSEVNFRAYGPTESGWCGRGARPLAKALLTCCHHRD